MMRVEVTASKAPDISENHDLKDGNTRIIKQSDMKVTDTNNSNSGIQNSISENIKVEFDELLMTKEENCSDNKDSIDEASQEQRSLWLDSGLDTTNQFDNMNSFEEIKLERDELSVVKEENNYFHVEPEYERTGEFDDKTVNQETRDEDTNISRKQKEQNTNKQKEQNSFICNKNENHLNFEGIACDWCDQSFSTNQFLYHHIKYVHNESSKRFSCHLCDYKTNSSYDLKIHIDGVHLNIKKYQCHSCHFKATKKVVLKIHIEGVHLNMKKYQCHLCEYKAAKKITLRMHIEGVHLNMKKHKCHSCDYKATTRASLKTHIEGVHLNLRKYQCYLCNYKAAKKITLRIHIEGVHLNMKKYKCHLCVYKATIKASLKRHFEGVHLNMRKYQCHLCDYKATKKITVRTHIEAVHPN